MDFAILAGLVACAAFLYLIGRELEHHLGHIRRTLDAILAELRRRK